MNIVITLAGHSRRFKEKGYDKPKFLIDIDDKPMIYHVVRLFNPEADNFYFVLNTEQKKEESNIIKILKSCAKNVHITEIEPHEYGPVYTALNADIKDSDNPVIVSYCDFFVVWNYKKFLEQSKNYSGAIASFKGFHPASFGNTYYAYTRQNENNELIELREKKSFTQNRSEEYANTGIYYFKSFNLFKKYADKLQKDGFGNLKEGYVSLIFNHLVKDGYKVKITDVEKFICWGTPEDLEEFYKWRDIIKSGCDCDFKSEFEKKSFYYWRSFFQKEF